jgi:hypothetical protein
LSYFRFHDKSPTFFQKRRTRIIDQRILLNSIDTLSFSLGGESTPRTPFFLPGLLAFAHGGLELVELGFGEVELWDFFLPGRILVFLFDNGLTDPRAKLD